MNGPEDIDYGNIGRNGNLGFYDLLEEYKKTIPDDEQEKWDTVKFRNIPDFLGSRHILFAHRKDTDEYLLVPMGMQGQRIVRVSASMIDKKAPGHMHVGFCIAGYGALVVAAAGFLFCALSLEYAMNGHQDKKPDVQSKKIAPASPKQHPGKREDFRARERGEEVIEMPPVDRKKEFDRTPLIDPNEPGSR